MGLGVAWANSFARAAPFHGQAVACPCHQTPVSATLLRMHPAASSVEPDPLPAGPILPIIPRLAGCSKADTKRPDGWGRPDCHLGLVYWMVYVKPAAGGPVVLGSPAAGRDESMKRLLATDLDGTFIGDDTAMMALWEALQARDIVLAFSTGRHLKSIQDFYTEKKVTRRADVCICMVGTDIYQRSDGAYTLDRSWHDVIAQDWDKRAVEGILRAIPEATMQDQEWQSPFKSSYYLEENVEQSLAQIHERLERAGLRAKVVYSAGQFLDLLPIRSGKGEAVRFVAHHYGVSPENVITSGDTGNDLDMMRAELGFRSIAVGNSAPELKDFRQPHVYHATAFYAAGIREGLEAHGWL